MLTRLTAAYRFWAASMLVAGYVVYILASTVAFASTNGSPHSFGHEHRGVADSGAESNAAAGSHAHPDGVPHQHPAPHDGEQSTSNCCGIACINALPASLPGVALAAMSAGVPLAMLQESVVGGAPPLLYRPPISL